MTEREKLDSPEKTIVWLLAQNPTFDRPSINEFFEAYGPETWWKLRERERFRIEKLKRPEWVAAHQQPGFDDFYIHAAIEDPLKISLIPSIEYGRADRRVVTTVGRFLGQYYKDKWTEAQIKAIADEHRAEFGPPVVHFLFDADSIVQAYVKGVHSCMAHEALAAGHEHPVGIYDSPDTGLACVVSGGRVTGRCVIRVDTNPMQYMRIYGDPVLKKRLEALGFVEGTLIGTRFRVSKHKNFLIMPYLDSCPTLKYERGAEFAVAAPSGNVSCRAAQGLIELPPEPDYHCDHCNTEMRKDNGRAAVSRAKKKMVICRACVANHFIAAYTKQHAQVYVPHDETFTYDYTAYHNTPETIEAMGFVMCAHDDTLRLKSDVIFVPSRNSHYVRRSVCTPYGATEPHMRSDCTYDETNERWILKKAKVAA